MNLNTSIKPGYVVSAEDPNTIVFNDYYKTSVTFKSNKKTYYLIGSLRNDYVRDLEKKILEKCPNTDIFLEWHGAGKHADDEFKAYHQGRGRSYREALKTDAARHIFEFDKAHLDSSDGAICVLPTGFSCALEAGYMVGRGKPVYGLYPQGEPDMRWDIMTQFLDSLYYSDDELIEKLNAVA